MWMNPQTLMGRDRDRIESPPSCSALGELVLAIAAELAASTTDLDAMCNLELEHGEATARSAR